MPKGVYIRNNIKIHKKCLSCNKTFSLIQSRSDEKFCSRKCYWKSLVGKENPEHSKRMQGKIPWNKGKSAIWIKGEKSHFWKGDKIKYSAIHEWLKSNFGRAYKCQASLVNLHCKRKYFQYHWAKIDNKKYLRKRDNFIQLCTSCHRIYDKVSMSRKRDNSGKFV